MVSEEGALYAATHADSRVKPGGKLKEGVFFLWSPDEIREVLTDKQAELVNAYYNVTNSGNHEGKNVLHTPRSRDAVAEELGLDRSTTDSIGPAKSCVSPGKTARIRRSMTTSSRRGTGWRWRPSPGPHSPSPSRAS